MRCIITKKGKLKSLRLGVVVVDLNEVNIYGLNLLLHILLSLCTQIFFFSMVTQGVEMMKLY